MAKMDEFSQYISFSVLETEANCYNDIEVEVPINIDSAQVIEITGIWLDMDAPDLVAGSKTEVRVQLTATDEAGILNFADEEIIFLWKKACISIAASVGSNVITETDYIDLTDDKGRGILYAFDQLWAAIRGANNTGAKGAQGRIYYRYVSVGAKELLQLLRSD